VKAVPTLWTRQYCSTLLFALLVGIGLPARLNSQESSVRDAPSEGTLQPARAEVTPEQIFTELVRHNELRNEALRSYSAVRSYAVTDPKGKVHAQKTVRLDYHAPDSKSFVTISENGSAVVRHLVLNRLMESETETASGKSHKDSTISPANYKFSLLGEEDLGPSHCFVLQATPTRSDKYLFDGKVWIDTQDYAVVQIVGHPAKKLSIWVDKADFVRRYQKIGDFWLPLKDETSVHVRFYGRKILTIDHGRYTINDAKAEQMQGGGESARR
jgi:outer membrane lipoprotein-sorting protein